MNIQGTITDKFSGIRILHGNNTLWEDANYTGKCNRLYEEKEKETVQSSMFGKSLDCTMYFNNYYNYNNFSAFIDKSQSEKIE